MSSNAVAIQDLYPDDHAHCYGCGRLNDEGLHVRTRWKAGVGTARFTPRPYHLAMPGYVYGGLLASLVDCHGIGTAAAAAMERAGERKVRVEVDVAAGGEVKVRGEVVAVRMPSSFIAGGG